MGTGRRLVSHRVPDLVRFAAQFHGDGGTGLDGFSILLSRVCVVKMKDLFVIFGSIRAHAGERGQLYKPEIAPADE
jgi:hypothetical protein